MKKRRRKGLSDEMKNAVAQAVWVYRTNRKPPMSFPALSRRLAERGVRIGRFALMKIEKGERHIKDFELKELSRVLGVPAEKLFGTWGKTYPKLVVPSANAGLERPNQRKIRVRR